MRLVLLLSLLLSSAHSFFWSKKSDDGLGGSGNDKSMTIAVLNNGEWENGQSLELSKADCASKADLGTLVCPRVGASSDCALFSVLATRVTSCSDLKNGDSVMIVPNGRLFMWPSYEVGHKTAIRHIGMPAGKPIVLETLSLRPRVFRLQDFFTEKEAEYLIEHALSITDDALRLKRSSTGATGYTVDNMRTSEGAFDTNSEIALNIKKRSFDLLGIFPYDESFADGIQILRYNLTTAYVAHMDWIEPTTLNNDHDWESAGDGTNRYATILLYLSDVADGGETVFTQAKPIGADAKIISKKQALEETTAYLEEKNLTHLFPAGTWQRNMISECRSRMAIKAKKAEAILFYSQFPDGRVDRLSLHGGCPVLEGTKWAANLWVWNGPRNGYLQKNPKTGKMEKPAVTSVSASFETEIDVGAELCWGDQVWETLTSKKPIKVNTYAGHEWNVKLDGKIILKWNIEGDRATQRFVLSASDIPAEI